MYEFAAVLQSAIWSGEDYVILSPLCVPDFSFTKGHCSHSPNCLMTEINKTMWRNDDKIDTQEVRDGLRGKEKVT